MEKSEKRKSVKKKNWSISSWTFKKKKTIKKKKYVEKRHFTPPAGISLQPFESRIRQVEGETVNYYKPLRLTNQ